MQVSMNIIYETIFHHSKQIFKNTFNAENGCENLATDEGKSKSVKIARTTKLTAMIVKEIIDSVFLFIWS